MFTTTVALETKGIMEQIRELFASGNASGEIIGMGFAPQTVYKVQRQLKKRDQTIGRRSVDNSQLITATMPARSGSELDAENDRLKMEVEELTHQLECTSEVSSQLVKMEDELEAEVKAFRERVSFLEPEASAAGQLRLRVKELEGQLQHEIHTQTAMRQGAVLWRTKLEAEQAARQKAEAQWGAWRDKAGHLELDNQRLQGAVEEWQQTAEKTNHMLMSIVSEVNELRKLKVWVGHPCRFCKKPQSGVVSREDAEKVMEDFGHQDCIKKHSGSKVGWFLVGAATLAALSGTHKRF